MPSHAILENQQSKNKVTEVSVKKKRRKVHIEEFYDGFAVIVGDERFRFYPEESIQGLVAVFTAAGCDDVSYEAVYTSELED